MPSDHLRGVEGTNKSSRPLQVLDVAECHATQGHHDDTSMHGPIGIHFTRERFGSEKALRSSCLRVTWQMQGAAWPSARKRVVPSAMTTIATYHVRMVNGRATASGEKGRRSSPVRAQPVSRSGLFPRPTRPGPRRTLARYPAAVSVSTLHASSSRRDTGQMNETVRGVFGSGHLGGGRAAWGLVTLGICIPIQPMTPAWARSETAQRQAATRSVGRESLVGVTGVGLDPIMTPRQHRLDAPKDPHGAVQRPGPAAAGGHGTARSVGGTFVSGTVQNGNALALF